MHAFVASLTAACIAIHAILGCCAHHAHPCESDHGHSADVCCHETTASETPTAVLPSSSTEESHPGHAPHSCAESHCVSLKPNEHGRQFVISVDVALPGAWHVFEFLPTAPTERFLSFDADHLFPPVDLYLLHHAFLI